MNAIILHRTDPAKNMRRFYMLDVKLVLFGKWCFIREWGRIGSAWQVRIQSYSPAAEANEDLARQRRTKERRGSATTFKTLLVARLRKSLLQCLSCFSVRVEQGRKYLA